MYCANCGKELPPQCKFCTRCGTQTARPENNFHSQENTLSQGRPYQNQQFPDMPFQNQQSRNNNQQFQNSNPQYSNSPFQNGNPQYSNSPFQNDNPQYSNSPFQNGNQAYQNTACGTSSGTAFADAAARGASNIAREAVHTAGRAKRTALLSLLVVGVFAILAVLYVLFIKTGTPEDTIAKLEKALNNLDQNAVLECFDEQANSLYSGALGVGEALSDLPLGDLADLASGLSGFLSAAGLTPDISIDIEDISYASDKKSCVVYVELTMEYMDEREKEEIALPMVLTGREWLISTSALAKTSMLAQL